MAGQNAECAAIVLGAQRTNVLDVDEELGRSRDDEMQP